MLEDPDLERAATLTVQGPFKESEQRCAAVKQMLALVDKVRAWTYGGSRKWDDAALDANGHTPEVEHFIGVAERLMAQR
ncbi:MAG TPA: hypothetical protein VHV99_27520 [Paraburkholderia sp.]|jgi:predicted HD phosphohydrolase|nr:hypothetical protein [Paraburkholderia sp.]